jgi:PPOX class probable F420-dependent enzyme
VSVLSGEVRKALTSGNLAHLTTLGHDGSPHTTIVWVGVDGDDIVSAHLGRYQKIRNIERDPRVSLSMVTGGKNPIGLDEYLVVYGTARSTRGGAPELLQDLARVYIGPDVRFPPMDFPPPGFVLRIRPHRIAGIGPWVGGHT